ncbi:integrase catalytic domain-containing protein [Fumia xinanensis]|uniref:Transposase family protein n=1 Tax=Fumia xinanensis TaxID=2763659 RepID=A0A926E073_9FIRM|nr:transposase family protein [Fumia xinanensis]
MTEMQKNIRWAINRYFYSGRRMSLNGAYEMLLLSKYTHSDGSLIEGYPTFYQFRYFYYSHENPIKKAISQQGLSYYQRNMRPLYGKSASYARSIGTYEIDATEADIYLVSKLDRSQVIGRPVIYMAVDVASQLIAGVYVGLQWGEESVIECLRNAASDKVEYAARYGIAVTKDQWLSCGLPGCLVTDRGMEFLGKRMEELCARYDITVTGLPPYRPDLKGSVEKAFDLLQGRYKPLLKRQGVIEEDFQERGAPDYRMEASLTLYEFTQIVIHCIVYNAGRVQYHFVRTSEMAADDVQPVANQIWDWYAQKGLMNLIPVSDNETHGVLLPREDGFLTRRGLAFRHLTYRNDRFHTRYAVAGIKGRESVKVAYDPLCTDTVYLIENGEYIPFSLTGASSGFENTTYAEVCRFLEEERALKNEWRKRKVQNKVDCAKSIREIAQNAADHHPSLNTKESIENMKENRSREEDGGAL